ncbi:tetratricopeptide repeat protein [Flavobacterium pallidum]|uniref:BatC protein n=1 Tax=Flavobacterium pallidum TaxID=2172098 RepID=A0A2S1SL85_9FLAO|nr:tetratricopeptide repeat protein [Flavobacterium pallidum]AWI27159.1 BatC protein [Flavobacterium pallidum]
MKKILTYALILIGFAVQAQQKEKDFSLPSGNEQLKKKKYAEAEADYRISKSRYTKNKTAATYNLGNSIYLQDQPEEAALAYQKVIKESKSREEKHKAYHNLGNIHMKQKNYEAAVDDYKNALINDPADEYSRYNYALAKSLLKKNPPKKDGKDKKKDENKKDQQKKQDQQKKDQDKGEDKKDPNKEGQDKPQPKEGENDPKGQPKPKEGGISKQRLQNLLEAVNNEEKKVQQKVNTKKLKGKPVQTEKDW